MIKPSKKKQVLLIMESSNNISEKRTGFKVPDNYFISLHESVFNKIQNDSVTRKTGFKIPDNYFGDFTIQTPESNSSPKVIALDGWSKWLVAASIMAFAILGALYIDRISPKQDVQISDLDQDMIEDYLDFHMENPDEFIDNDNLSLDQMINTNLVNLESRDILDYLNEKIEDQNFEDE